MQILIKDLNLRKILISVKNINKNGKDNKEYDDVPYKWHSKTIQELEIINNDRININKYNQYLVRLDNQYLVFDTDNEKAFMKLEYILKEKKLYNNLSITKSYKGKAYNLYYQRHFWFKINPKQYSRLEQAKINFKGGEIFFGYNCQIAEFKESVLENLIDLDIGDYYEIYDEMNKLIIDEDNEKINIDNSDDEKEIVKKDINKRQITKNNKINTENGELINILDNLDEKRYIEYSYWLILYFIFINENYDLELFDLYSEKRGLEKYDKIKNNNILKNIVPKKGYTISTLYFWLKEDNKKVYDEMQKTRNDIWDMFENLQNHIDPANLYYSLNQNKYIRSELTGWYEYNENNILIFRGKDTPTSMLNNITYSLQSILKEQRDFIVPENKNDEAYKKKMKIFKSAYDKVGKAPYIKGVIEYLKFMYTKDKLDDLIDSDVNLFAFDNLLYDNKIKNFRKIEPTDYICKTAKYNINLKSNKEIRQKIEKLIKEMFESEDIYLYHLRTIALSMFGNKNESFYINTGKGRNGKGLCSQFVEKSFGSYFYQGESTFYTTVYRADRPNSTLYNLKGVRYFLTTEPESDNDTKFNIGLVKSTTGSDSITTRDLGKSNITYSPQFTPFMQCNRKPKIDNVDNAVKNRFKIIDFPYSFVDEPTKPNEKLVNNNLKSNINQEWYNEFMLLLLDINKNMPEKLKTPQEILNNIYKYLDDNNIVKKWLDNTFIYTESRKDIIKFSELLDMYNNSGFGQILTSVKFSESLNINDIKARNLNGCKYHYGLKVKPLKDKDEDEDDNKF